MKVLMLNYEFPPLGGGAANHSFNLLKEFSKEKDLEIDLITASSSKFMKKRWSKKITVYFLDIGKGGKNLHYQSSLNLLIYFVKAFFYARSLSKKNNYDLVHSFFGIPCGITALLLGKPYIVSLMGSDVPFFNQRFYWADRLIFEKISKKVWEKAEKVIANSNGLKQLALNAVSNQEIDVIVNGTDICFFCPGKIKKKQAIIFTGRLIKRKGLESLISAFSNLSKPLLDSYQLWIIGDGPEKQRLRELTNKLEVNKKVQFLGRLNKKELQKLLQQAELFVLPSLNEGMSNALLEAMACGLPVITTNTGGSLELINKENGIIVKKGDIKQLTNAMEQILIDKKLQKFMGQAGRKKAENYPWKENAKAYLKIYHRYKRYK